MSKPLAIGLVGAGRIAQAYAQAIEKASGVRFCAVADLRVEQAEAMSAHLGCPGFSDPQRMLEEAGCEAVLICTPPTSHAEICLAALERGLPVLCEKPLSTDLSTARQMVETAERKGVLLSMASKFRFVDDVVRARKIVTSGILGEIILFENTFSSRVDMASRWNSDPAISGGGVLIDNGTHSVDLVRYFLGPIAEVHTVGGKNIQDLPVEDTVRIFLKTRGGAIGSIDLSWSLNKEMDSYLDIYGSRGTVRVGWKESKYRQDGSADWVRFGTGYDKLQAFRSNLENFSAAVRGREQLVTSTNDALASVEVVDAAYRSLRHSHWEPVESEGRTVDDAAARIAVEAL